MLCVFVLKACAHEEGRSERGVTQQEKGVREGSSSRRRE
jgi:hypothetical protein